MAKQGIVVFSRKEKRLPEGFIRERCALIHCLRQQLFDASVGDQDSRFPQDFWSITTSTENAKGGMSKCGRSDSKTRYRRYRNDSSESGHTQYAFPKKGNAGLENFTS